MAANVWSLNCSIAEGCGYFHYTLDFFDTGGGWHKVFHWSPSTVDFWYSHSSPSSAEVNEWVGLYLPSPNTPPWRGAQLTHRDNFTFTLLSGRFLLNLSCMLLTSSECHDRHSEFNMYEGVSKSFRTESMTKYTLTFGITCWEATWRVIATKLIRLTHKIAIQLHLVAESCTSFSSLSRRPVRKIWIHLRM
jgi:hypothetical protein